MAAEAEPGFEAYGLRILIRLSYWVLNYNNLCMFSDLLKRNTRFGPKLLVRPNP
ncbi:hypothetical protein RND71_017066 [Anisodus tanguticus]|uniref:Uncharacterized protein n=1 Tax=Anisodus tanguticus TaxID=243964 RepID=A0AAE1VIS1_9SOLA|nr:hypothetical protein RND71_017066 [Anisodus tanguticus]